MAYQLSNYVTDSSIELPSAYLHITHVDLNKKSLVATVSYEIYATKSAYSANYRLGKTACISSTKRISQ